MKNKERVIYIGIIIMLLISLVYTHIIANRELELLAIKFDNSQTFELELINKYKQRIKKLEQKKEPKINNSRL